MDLKRQITLAENFYFCTLMHRFFAIHLLALFLFSALVPAQTKEELAKLPTLLKHYKEHQSETPGMGFFKFWKMHYSEDFAQHQSDHDHSGLPMKHHCDHAHAAALALLPPSSFNTPRAFELTNHIQPLFIDQSYAFALLHDIWQPPRV